MAKCLYCMIRLGCLRIASGVLDAPFPRFDPPALNNFGHPWLKLIVEGAPGIGVGDGLSGGLWPP